jgi:hypothetical protein
VKDQIARVESKDSITQEAPFDWAVVEQRHWLGSMSSSMQEAAIRLLDAITVSNLPHC